jgi:hypothetical protein
MMEPEPEKKPRESSGPRKRRATAIYDRDGNEVLISLMCLKCRTVKPLAQFGLRKMADGAIRNQPWCRTCRSGAGTHRSKKPASEVTAEARVPSAGEVQAAEVNRVPVTLEEERAPIPVEDAGDRFPEAGEGVLPMAAEDVAPLPEDSALPVAAPLAEDPLLAAEARSAAEAQPGGQPELPSADTSALEPGAGPEEPPADAPSTAPEDPRTYPN